VVCVYNKKERKVEIYDVAAVCFFAFFLWLACTFIRRTFSSISRLKKTKTTGLHTY